MRKSKKLPFVSIVIPTRNRKKDIAKCLYFIRRLDYPNKNIEIIIWDNGSTDSTRKEVSRIFAEMEKEGWKNLCIIQSNVNLGGFTTRDELFKRVGREMAYVLSLDDDVFLPRDSLTLLLGRLQGNSRQALLVLERYTSRNQTRLLTELDL
ncbi:MAG: glycosyltransferase [Candidatus Scalindua brodae]|uniref:Glycosyltransferase n=1 Tax=Candidatus Scalindua brodae TaxID=237368 RepID=A0A0B0EIS9_9BACT|nr:MAG: glycosyltransferase [Candidatus Scalindua brodae]